MRAVLQPLVLSLSLLALGACASSPKTRVGTAAAPAPGVKVGKPYQVFGKTYVPHDDRSYDEHGIASWYGPTFHSKPTANGEIYNQDDLTAAHKTLPMPSWVEVTNKDNGRKLVVRVNDRGPFVDGRIIDLSRRSAQLLGVDRAGLARVRVKRVYPPGDWALNTPGPDGKAQQVSVAAAPQAPVPAPAPVAVTSQPSYPTAVAVTPVPASTIGTAVSQEGHRYIQVAALSDEGRARALASVLADYGPANATQAPNGLWRVRLGPVAAGSVEPLLFEIRTAGYREAQVVQ